MCDSNPDTRGFNEYQSTLIVRVDSWYKMTWWILSTWLFLCLYYRYGMIKGLLILFKTYILWSVHTWEIYFLSILFKMLCLTGPPMSYLFWLVDFKTCVSLLAHLWVICFLLNLFKILCLIVHPWDVCFDQLILNNLCFRSVHL
jgi:hypothetical protein